jgi:hypothetical protein
MCLLVSFLRWSKRMVFCYLCPYAYNWMGLDTKLRNRLLANGVLAILLNLNFHWFIVKNRKTYAANIHFWFEQIQNQRILLTNFQNNRLILLWFWMGIRSNCTQTFDDVRFLGLLQNYDFWLVRLVQYFHGQRSQMDRWLFTFSWVKSRYS